MSRKDEVKDPGPMTENTAVEDPLLQAKAEIESSPEPGVLTAPSDALPGETLEEYSARKDHERDVIAYTMMVKDYPGAKISDNPWLFKDYQQAADRSLQKAAEVRERNENLQKWENIEAAAQGREPRVFIDTDGVTRVNARVVEPTTADPRFSGAGKSATEIVKQ